MTREAAADIQTNEDYKRNVKGAIVISLLNLIAGIIIISILSVAIAPLYRFIRIQWQWYRVKRAGANLGRYMEGFFSNLPPRESEFCKDCKHSDVSINNGNLLCLHERSRHFGEAIAPENDKMGFCYFEREGNEITVKE